MLSKKIKSRKSKKIIKTEKGTAEVLNAFFSNIVQNLDIQQYNVDDPICENINDPLLKAIVRYRNHTSIAAIKKSGNSKSRFSFKNAQKEEILTELNNLNINKATQNTDIPTKIIKENSDIFGDFVFSNRNCCINTFHIHRCCKGKIYQLFIKRTQKARKIIKDQLVYCQTSPSYMKGSCLNICQNILKNLFSLNVNVDLGKVLVLSTV